MTTKKETIKNLIDSIDHELIRLSKNTDRNQMFDFESNLTRLLSFADEAEVRDRLSMYYSVFADLFSSSRFPIKSVESTEITEEGDEYNGKHVILYTLEYKGRLYKDYVIAETDSLERMKASRTYSLQKIRFFGKLKPVPGSSFFDYIRTNDTYQRDILTGVEVRKTFFERVRELAINPMMGVSFENYVNNLSPSEHGLTKEASITKVKEITSFRDIFVSDDAYKKAMEWLTDNGHFKNGKFVHDKKYCVELFNSLQMFGYSIPLSNRDKQHVSELIGRRYAHSSFGNNSIPKVEELRKEKRNELFYNMPDFG